MGLESLFLGFEHDSWRLAQKRIQINNHPGRNIPTPTGQIRSQPGTTPKTRHNQLQRLHNQIPLRCSRQRSLALNIPQINPIGFIIDRRDKDKVITWLPFHPIIDSLGSLLPSHYEELLKII